MTTNNNSSNQNASLTSVSDRESDIRHAAIGGLTNFLHIFGALAVPLFHSVIVWAFGPVIYGLYAVGSAAAETFGRLGTMGTDKGLWRYIAAYRIAGDDHAAHDSLYTAVFISTGLSVALSIFVFFLAAWLAPFFGSAEYKDSIAWLAPSIPLFALVSIFVSATLGAKVFRYNLIVKGFAQPVLLVLIALLAAFWPSLASLSVAHLLSLLLTAIVAAYCSRKVFMTFEPRAELQKPRIRWELVRFSIPLGLSEFLNTIMHRASLIILAFHLTAIQLAAFAACEMLVRAVAAIRNAFDPIISPILSEALQLNDHERMNYNLKLVTRWVILLAIPIMISMVLFASEILSLLNTEFSVASSSLILLSIGYSINTALGLNGWILIMGGYSWLALGNNLISAATTVGLGLWLIPKYGVFGGAIATASSVVLVQILILIEVWKLKKVQPLSFASIKVILMGIFCFGLSFFLSREIPLEGFLRFFVELPIFLGLYVVLWRFLAFEEDDQQLFKQLKRIFKKSS